MPVSRARGRASGLNTRVPPWEERRLVALCGPPGSMQAAPAPAAERAESSPASPAQGTTLEIQESRPLSQGFCNPNYREMTENVPPNQCRHSLQGSYPEALPTGSRQFSKPLLLLSRVSRVRLCATP